MKIDNITPRVEIDGRNFNKAMCRENSNLILATCCVEKDYSCRTYFMGIGKSFVLDCYNF